MKKRLYLPPQISERMAVTYIFANLFSIWLNRGQLDPQNLLGFLSVGLKDCI